MLLNCGIGEYSWESLGQRYNQSIIKEIGPEYSLDELMLRLSLQYIGYLMWRADSFEKTLMLWKIEGGRRRGQQRMTRLDGKTNQWVAMHMTQCTWVWVNSRSWWWAGRPGMLQSLELQRIGLNWVTELNWWYFIMLWMKEFDLSYLMGIIWC